MLNWQYPETWAVGDKTDAETLNRRIRDQNTLLLRRPLLVARISSNVTAHSGSTTLQFDTIDSDDDGMCATGTPATEFYVQRDGTYTFFLSVTAYGNGNPCGTAGAGLVLNGSTRRWDMFTQMASNNGFDYTLASTGTLFLNAGEYFHAWFYQNSGYDMTIPAVNNAPRLAVMWLGVS